MHLAFFHAARSDPDMHFDMPISAADSNPISNWGIFRRNISILKYGCPSVTLMIWDRSQLY